VNRCVDENRWLQTPAHAGSSLADFSTLKMEAIRSSEMSVHTESTGRHTPKDGIFHSYRRENLKSYIVSDLTRGWTTEQSVIDICSETASYRHKFHYALLSERMEANETGKSENCYWCFIPVAL
jgi:hypothetical protein